MSNPLIVRLKKTCESCPSQWEGELDNGRFLYARYRHGCLTWGFGETPRDAVSLSMEMPGLELGEPLDGELSTQAMMDEVRLRFA